MASYQHDYEPDFDDELATLVADRRTLFGHDAPPALPFALKRRTLDDLSLIHI